MKENNYSFIDLEKTVEHIEIDERYKNLAEFIKDKDNFSDNDLQFIRLELCHLIALYTGKNYYDISVMTILKLLSAYNSVEAFGCNDDGFDDVIKDGFNACNHIFEEIAYINLPFIEVRKRARCVNNVALAEYLVENLPLKLIDYSGKYTEKDSEIVEYNGSFYETIDSKLDSIILKILNMAGVTNYSPKTISDIKRFIRMTLMNESRVHNINDFNADETLVNVKNGVLKLAAGKITLLEHSEEYLFTSELPCNYLKVTSPTPFWDRYLEHLCEGNAEVKNFLRQYLGAIFSNVKGHTFKKSLFLTGAGNSGKSIIHNVSEDIIGPENCSAIELEEMTKRFGLSSIKNKRMIGSADSKIGRVDNLNNFKKLTGGDKVEIEEKCKPKYQYQFNGLIMICGNKMPVFGGDKGDWVYDRIIIIPCNNVVPEDKRDHRLREKIFTEKDSIFTDCINYFVETAFISRTFDIPGVAENAMKEFKKKNDSVLSFADECLRAWKANESMRKSNTSVSIIYAVYKDWCAGNKFSPEPISVFRDSLRRMQEATDYIDIVTQVNGRYYFKNLTLNNVAKDDFSRVIQRVVSAGEKTYA